MKEKNIISKQVRISYRTLQIMNILFKDSICQSFFPFLLISFSIGYIVVITVATLFYQAFNLPMIIMAVFIMIIITWCLILGLYKCCVVSHNSEIFLRQLNIKFGRSRIIKRFVISCPTINIYVGQFFKVRPSLCLTTMKFSFEMAITLIFTSRVRVCHTF